MKKLLSTLLLFLCIHLHAQPFTLKYIYQYSTATAPPTNYWLLLDPGNGQYQKSSIQSVGTVIGNFLQITNGSGTFTNIFSTNITSITINSTTNIAQYSFLTNIYGPFITNFVLYSTNIFTTNLFASFITNNTFYSTNIFATNIVANNVYATSNFFTVTKGGTLIVTNASTTYQTNSTFITTNVTINAPGGLTNLNATPKTVAWWDANDTLLYIPNASGFMTNNGSGDVGWSTVLALTELDAQNAWLTNTFIFITNKFAYPDSNGQLTGLANSSGVLQNDGSGGFSWVAAPAPGGAAGGVLSGTYPNPGFANPDTFPGPVTVPSLTNAGNMLMKGTETNSTMGTGLVHSDSLGGRSSSAVVAGDISGALTQNTSGTATFVTQPAILSFASASNSIAMSTNINNVFFFVASTAVSLTNVTGSIAGQMTYADLIVSNSLATSITNYQTIPGAKIFGVNSAGTATNALIIAAGKEGLWHLECRGINETNAFNCVQQ